MSCPIVPADSFLFWTRTTAHINMFKHTVTVCLNCRRIKLSLCFVPLCSHWWCVSTGSSGLVHSDMSMCRCCACVNWKKKNLLYSTVPLSLIVYVWHKSHSLPSYSLHELYPPTWIKKTRFFSFFRSWPKISLMWLKLDSFGTTFSFFSFFFLSRAVCLCCFFHVQIASRQRLVTFEIWDRAHIQSWTIHENHMKIKISRMRLWSCAFIYWSSYRCFA